MKKIFVLFLLVISVNVFSQQPVPAKSEEIKNSENVYETADKQPEYPGGLLAFRQKFSAGIKSNKLIGKGFASAEAQFVIDRDGTITDIRVKGDNYSLNDEVKKSLTALAKIKWSPAEINGQPVRYKFRLPVKANID